MAIFQILFLKSHISLSFWVRELGEVSFDSKFLTDYHTGRNFKWETGSLFLENITCYILCMLFTSLNILLVSVWHNNLLGVINYIDRYIECDNIEYVQQD